MGRGGAACLALKVMSSIRDAEKLLKDAGFEFQRATRHGEMWAHPQGERLAIPRQFLNNRGFNNFRADLRRALRKMGIEEIIEPVMIAGVVAEVVPLRATDQPREIRIVPQNPSDKVQSQRKKIPDAVLNVITSQDLTEKQKVGMLLGFGEFPSPVLNILGAPELNTNQKVRMLEAFMEATE